MRQQTFIFTISGANRSLTAGDIKDMIEEAYMVYYQDDIDYLEPKVIASALLNEIHI